VPIARFLRIVSFAPDGNESAVDAALREMCVPALLADRDVLDAWVGRQGSRDDRRRVIASTWTATPSSGERQLLDSIASAVGIAIRIESERSLELAVHARFERPEPARILRVFHGRVQTGELDGYVADARSGMLADAMVNDGLVAFALGSDPPDGFVTVSAWTGWSAIEEATGGNTRQPIATRNSVRLTGFEVVHFETLPDAANRGIAPSIDERRMRDGDDLRRT
jgi:hypothetical protein